MTRLLRLRARRPGLRRPRRGAARRGADRAAARLPRARVLLGRGGAAAARRGVPDPRARPARLLAGRPARPGARLPMDKLVADVVALIDAIGGPVHLVGHDWGATSAWLVAMHRPELVRSLTAVWCRTRRPSCESLFPSDRASRPGTWAPSRPRSPELLAARPGGRFDRGLRHGGMTAEDVARFRREIVDDGALTGALNWYRAMPFTRQALPPRPRLGADDAAVGRRRRPGHQGVRRRGARRPTSPDPTSCGWSRG